MDIMKVGIYVDPHQYDKTPDLQSYNSFKEIVDEYLKVKRFEVEHLIFLEDVWAGWKKDLLIIDYGAIGNKVFSSRGIESAVQVILEKLFERPSICPLIWVTSLGFDEGSIEWFDEDVKNNVPHIYKQSQLIIGELWDEEIWKMIANKYKESLKEKFN